MTSLSIPVPYRILLGILFAIGTTGALGDLVDERGPGYVPLPDEIQQELNERGYLDQGTNIWHQAQDADEDTLKTYADQVDSALAGDVGQKLSEHGYKDKADSLWARIKAILFGDAP